MSKGTINTAINLLLNDKLPYSLIPTSIIIIAKDELGMGVKMKKLKKDKGWILERTFNDLR